MPAIHQFTAALKDGDAVTNEALLLRDMFRAWGYCSEIYTDPVSCHPALPTHARDAADGAVRVERDDIALLHFSIGSPVNAVFADLSCRKVLLYHNITPADWFRVVNPQVARDLSRGRTQLAALANVAEINLADSAFNARELVKVGYRDVKVFPLAIDFERLLSAHDPAVLRDFGDGTINVLFVGRSAPNKRIEDIIDVFALFHGTSSRASRLLLVGSTLGTERYHGTLLGLAHELGLDDAVHFIGEVPQSRLNAFYRCADVFLCMSEHEGFCIPVIESMVHDVPVLAYAGGAVPETLDGAGILFTEKKFEQVAEMMNRLCSDTGFREAVLRGQRERLGRFRARDLAAELKQHLAPLLCQ